MIYIMITAVTAAFDLLIKDYIDKNLKMHESRNVLKGWLSITRYHNDGAVMNSFKGNKKIVLYMPLIILTGAAILFIILLRKKDVKLKKLGMSLMIGGGISNIYERWTKGYVVDYISFAGSIPKKLKKIVFNLADLLIFTGAMIYTAEKIK